MSQQSFPFNTPNGEHVDFHMHSIFSDGALTPTDLAALVKQVGICHWALTDHDTVSGIAEAQQASLTNDLIFYPGIELSTHWLPAGKTKTVDVHIVGLGLKNLPLMQELLAKQQQARGQRAKAMADKIAQLFRIDPWADLLSYVDNDPDRLTRTHFAKWLVDHRIVVSPQQAFDRYLADGKSLFVPIAGVSLAAAINMIRATGGIAVLAHPTRYDLSATMTRQLIAEFAQAGGQAIELAPVKEPPSKRTMIEQEGQKHGLMASYASDFHGPHMPWVRLGVVPPLSTVLPHVLDALQSQSI